jgi:hypothetical protein
VNWFTKRGGPLEGAGLRSRAFLMGFSLKPELGVACFWRLPAGWPRRKPFGGAENPPIAFIHEVKKQVRHYEWIESLAARVFIFRLLNILDFCGLFWLAREWRLHPQSPLEMGILYFYVPTVEALP